MLSQHELSDLFKDWQIFKKPVVCALSLKVTNDEAEGFQTDSCTQLYKRMLQPYWRAEKLKKVIQRQKGKICSGLRVLHASIS